MFPSIVFFLYQKRNMSTAELKNILIEKIQATDNESLLRDVTRLMEIQLVESEPPFELTEEMNLAIDEAKEQIRKGDCQDHDEANNEIDK